MPIDLTPIVKPINDVAEPLTNSLSDAWSAVLGDKIAAWRLRNAAATQVKLHDELKRMGVSLNHAKIPERYAFAWFDEATKQDEPEIQDLFARLLAKAAAGDKDAGDRRNLEILTRMTPMDASTLNWFLEFCGYPKRGAFAEKDIFTGALHDAQGEEGMASFEHLLSLGVFEIEMWIGQQSDYAPWQFRHHEPSLKEAFESLPDHLQIEQQLSLSNRGMSLVRACAVSGAPATPS